MARNSPPQVRLGETMLPILPEGLINNNNIIKKGLQSMKRQITHPRFSGHKAQVGKHALWVSGTEVINRLSSYTG